ncbi:hypothetical protein KR49_09630 [Synechococcus sp. KORDI-49]|nr:hypothetical protein KR49_09630 [Synechococcus sp. KORDI-49]
MQAKAGGYIFTIKGYLQFIRSDTLIPSNNIKYTIGMTSRAKNYQTGHD